MHNLEDSVMIEALSCIPEKSLDHLVKEAKKLRAKNSVDKIPQALKDSLVRKHDRVENGSTTSIIINPELCFTFTVKAHSDWEETDWSVKLVNDDDVRSKAFFELFDLSNQEWVEGERMHKLEPHLNAMIEQERIARQSWDDDYYHLSSEFGVNAYDLVEELKKEDTP